MTPVCYLTAKDTHKNHADTLLASRCVPLIGKTLNFEQIPLSAEGHVLPPGNTAAAADSSGALRAVPVPCRRHRTGGRRGEPP